MAILTRLINLFRADVNGMLDTIQEPMAVLKQAILDMEEQVATRRAHLEQLTKEAEQSTARQTDVARRVEEVQREIELCFRENNEKLARAMVRKKLEITRLHTMMSEKVAKLLQEKEAEAQSLGDQEKKLKDIHDKLDLLSIKLESTQVDENRFSSDNSTASFAVTEEDVEVAFLRERRQCVAPQSEGEKAS